MHVPLTTLDFLERAESVFTDRTAVVDEPAPPGGGLGSFTYGELGRRARSIAVAFDELGLDAGDRIAILSPNAGRFLIALFGIPAHGRVLVPINFRLNRDEIAYIVEHSGSTALLVDPEYDELTRDIRDGAPLRPGRRDRRRPVRATGHAPVPAPRTRPPPRRSTTRPARPRVPRACR